MIIKNDDCSNTHTHTHTLLSVMVIVASDRGGREGREGGDSGEGERGGREGGREGREGEKGEGEGTSTCHSLAIPPFVWALLTCHEATNFLFSLYGCLLIRNVSILSWLYVIY